MADKSWLDWPFLNDKHRALAPELDRWASEQLADIDHANADLACQEIVKRLGRSGWLEYAACDPGDAAPLDVRALCLIRDQSSVNAGCLAFDVVNT